jgi:hypothetical protein
VSRQARHGEQQGRIGASKADIAEPICVIAKDQQRNWRALSVRHTAYIQSRESDRHK